MHPYFKKRLQPIAVIILIFFAWFSIEPWNYAVWAQSLPDSQDSLPLTKSTSQRFEESLRSIKQVVADLDQQVASGKDITKTLERLNGYRKNMGEADPKIRDEFAKEEAHLKKAGLPALILDRHKKAAAEYNTNYKTLDENLDSIIRLESERKKAKSKKDKDLAQRKLKGLKVKIKATAEQLKEKVKEPRHTPFKPSAPTNRSRKLKPVKTSWLEQIGNFLLPYAYAAEPPGPSDLAGTEEAPLSQEIIDLANQLGGSSVRLYEFVRNNFRYEPYAGSLKGATQTLKEGGGNEWDQASLLIALFRASGIPARYVVGTVEIPTDKAMSWLGVEDANMAGSLLATLGRPTTTIVSGGKITAIQTQHVWVQAYVPFISSRGAVPGPGDTWVDMDPSFKGQTKTQTLTLTGIPLFDQADYLSAFRLESPLDFYRNQLQVFLNTNASGFLPEALARNLDIVPEPFGIIIGQPPYTIRTTIATYSEIPDTYRQKFTITISDPITGEIDLSYTSFLPSIIGKRLTLSYAPATAADETTISAYGDLFSTPAYLVSLKPQLKLDGILVAEGSPVGAGEEERLVFLFNNTINSDQVENIIISGGYYSIGLDVQNVPQIQALSRIDKLRTISDQITAGQPVSLDDHLGELLYVTAMTYHQKLDAATRQIRALHQVVTVRDISVIMAFVDISVAYLFGAPKSISPAGLIVDLDRNVHTVIPVDGDLSRIKPFMQLIGNQSSYLEHKVLEEIYETQAVSAVKVIQLAHDQGIPVHAITNQNISTILPLLRLSEEVKTDIINAVNSGQEVIVPERDLTVQDWIGVGYIIQDPIGGDGTYRISGGFGGGSTASRLEVAPFLLTIYSFQIAMYRQIELAELALEPELLTLPGPDNIIYTGDDKVYAIIPLTKALKNDLCTEKESENDCTKKYKDPNPEGMSGLIEINTANEGDKISTHLTLGQFKSNGFAPYLRISLTLIVAIEKLIAAFNADPATGSARIESGYRTWISHKAIYDKKGKTPTEKSYHLDGVAADLVISNSKGDVPKGDVCNALKILLDKNGGIGVEDSLSSMHFDMRNSSWQDNPCPK